MSLYFFKEARFIDSKVVSNFSRKAIFQQFSGMSCLIFNVTEFLCFLVIFVEMSKRHRRHVKLCLMNKPKLAKKKKRRNTVTAVGHFVSWSVEILLFGVGNYLIMASKKTNNSTALHFIYFKFLVPSINYVIFPLVQAITSEELRDCLFNFDHCKETCLVVYHKFRKDTNGIEDGGASDIELQTLGNPKGNDFHSAAHNSLVSSLFEDRPKSCIYPPTAPRIKGKLPKYFTL